MALYTPLLPRDVADADALNTVLSALESAMALVTTVPAGTIIGFAGANAPSGWLLCDGSAVSRSTYAALFAIIGTTYGVGDGGSTFNLPDLRGRIPIGAGTGVSLTARTLGQSLGEEAHQLTIPEIPSHDHNAPALAAATGQLSGVVGGLRYHASASGTTGSTGGDGSHNNIQPSTVLTPIIKV